MILIVSHFASPLPSLFLIFSIFSNNIDRYIAFPPILYCIAFPNSFNIMGYSPKGSPKETSQRGSLRRQATPGRHSRRSSSGMLFRQPSYQPPPNEEARHIFEKRVERWRCYAYLFFWSLIFLAKFMTKHYVVEMLAAGVDKMTVPKERWGCGPFNRVSRCRQSLGTSTRHYISLTQSLSASFNIRQQFQG